MEGAIVEFKAIYGQRTTVSDATERSPRPQGAGSIPVPPVRRIVLRLNDSMSEVAPAESLHHYLKGVLCNMLKYRRRNTSGLQLMTLLGAYWGE